MFVSIQPLMVVAWLATLFIVAWLVRGIAKAAIDKADAKDVTQVLQALSPILCGLARIFTAARKSSTELTHVRDTGSIGSDEDAQHEKA